jgi:hypothetical protein
MIHEGCVTSSKIQPCLEFFPFWIPLISEKVSKAYGNLVFLRRTKIFVGDGDLI